MTRTPITWMILAAGMLAAGCAYRGADDPVSRKFSWFSYLNGDDIRAACEPGREDRYRFVYNGINIEQRRTYDIAANAGPRGHRMDVTVIGPAEIKNLQVGGAADLLRPWQGEQATVWLLDRNLDGLHQAMAADGMFSRPPVGLTLHAIDFYWLAVGCRDGQMFFDAMRWPSERFKEAAVPGFLLAWDATGVPVNPPRQASPRTVYQGSREENESRNYRLEVGEDGLVNLLTLF